MEELSLERAMELTLDEYIRVKKIKHPFDSAKDHSKKNQSKFDRYRDIASESDDDEWDKPTIHRTKASSQMELNDAAEAINPIHYPEEMPRLVPTQQENIVGVLEKPKNDIWNNQTEGERVSVHERLGQNHSGKLKNNNRRFNQQNRFYYPYHHNQNGMMRFSVQNRLGKNYVNPAIVIANNQVKDVMMTFANNGQEIMKGFASTIFDELKSLQDNQMRNEGKKYDMTVQKEISGIQGKQLFYKCPGAAVVSFDGPGIETTVNIPQSSTGMTLNQRFA